MNQTTRLTAWLAVLWLITANILFFMPGSALPSAGWMDAIKADKWVHIAIFFFLYYLWQNAFQLRCAKAGIGLALIFFEYGWLVEVVQDQWVVNRSFDVFDVVADTTGIVLGWMYGRYIKK